MSDTANSICVSCGEKIRPDVLTGTTCACARRNPFYRPSVSVPPGAIWWADGVLPDADFLRKMAEGFAFADPRGFRLMQIADRIQSSSPTDE